MFYGGETYKSLFLLHFIPLFFDFLLRVLKNVYS